MLDPVHAGKLPRRGADAELHRGRAAARAAAIHRQPARPQAGGKRPGGGCSCATRTRVVPTADGEAMIGFAHSILEANERARRYFAGSQLRGRVRFGTSEDFVSRPACRRCCATSCSGMPLVDLELTVGVSATLYEDAG